MPTLPVPVTSGTEEMKRHPSLGMSARRGPQALSDATVDAGLQARGQSLTVRGSWLPASNVLLTVARAARCLQRDPTDLHTHLAIHPSSFAIECVYTCAAVLLAATAVSLRG